MAGSELSRGRLHLLDLHLGSSAPAETIAFWQVTVQFLPKEFPSTKKSSLSQDCTSFLEQPTSNEWLIWGYGSLASWPRLGHFWSSVIALELSRALAPLSAYPLIRSSTHPLFTATDIPMQISASNSVSQEALSKRRIQSPISSPSKRTTTPACSFCLQSNAGKGMEHRH